MALVVAPGGVGVALRGARAPALGDLVVQAPADGQRDRQRDESRVNTENRRDEQQLTRPNEEDGEIHKREVCEEERRKDWEKDGTMGRKKEKKEGRHRQIDRETRSQIDGEFVKREVEEEQRR